MLTRRYRIDEICAALGYNSDRVPKSVESIYKVHAATKSTPVTPFNPNFEVLVPSSFQSNDRPLTSGEINGMSLRSGLISTFSVKPVSPSPAERSEHEQKFCKLA